MSQGLTDKALQAINYRMAGMTKTGALREVGYLKTTWTNEVTRWWNQPAVKTELQKRRKKLADKADVDSGWLVERLKAIVDFDVGKLVNAKGELIPMAKLEPQLRKALSVTIAHGKIKITQDDRLKAMDQIARLGGLYEDKIKIEGEIDLKARLVAGRHRAALKNKE